MVFTGRTMVVKLKSSSRILFAHLISHWDLVLSWVMNFPDYFEPTVVSNKSWPYYFILSTVLYQGSTTYRCCNPAAASKCNPIAGSVESIIHLRHHWQYRKQWRATSKSDCRGWAPLSSVLFFEQKFLFNISKITHLNILRGRPTLLQGTCEQN